RPPASGPPELLADREHRRARRAAAARHARREAETDRGRGGTRPATAAAGAGLAERQRRDMLDGNANRIAAGEDPLEPSMPSGTDEFSQSMALARIHQYLSMATPLLWTREATTRDG